MRNKFFFFFLLLSLFSCSEEPIYDSDGVQLDIEDAQDLGSKFHSDSKSLLMSEFGADVVETEFGFIVEGDQFVDKKSFEDFLSKAKNVEKSNYYDGSADIDGVTYFFRPVERANLDISYFISNNFNSNHTNLLTAAFNHFSNISSNDITFTVASSAATADVFVGIEQVDTELPSFLFLMSNNVRAGAAIAIDGNPGSAIAFNDWTIPEGRPAGNHISDNLFTGVAIHEIGHILGLGHSETTGSEIVSGQSVNKEQINCTINQNSSCSQSIMFTPCSPGNTLTALASDDIKGLKYLYPSNFNPSIISHSVVYNTQSTRTVTLNFGYTWDRANKIEILRYWPGGGSLAQTYNASCYSSGNYSLNTSPWPGSWDFRVRYSNAYGDYQVTSPLYTVNMAL